MSVCTTKNNMRTKEEILAPINESTSDTVAQIKALTALVEVFADLRDLIVEAKNEDK